MRGQLDFPSWVARSKRPAVPQLDRWYLILVRITTCAPYSDSPERFVSDPCSSYFNSRLSFLCVGRAEQPIYDPTGKECATRAVRKIRVQDTNTWSTMEWFDQPYGCCNDIAFLLSLLCHDTTAIKASNSCFIDATCTAKTLTGATLRTPRRPTFVVLISLFPFFSSPFFYKKFLACKVSGSLAAVSRP